MKFLPLLWRNLMRRKVRTIFTFLSVVVAFFLFGLLMAVKNGFDAGIQIAGQDRLLTIHKISIIQLLPIRYLEQIRNVPGVADATHATWFGGVYQDPKNFFPQIATEPEGFLDLYPSVVAEEQLEAWKATRTGAVVGEKLMERFEWEIGDRIPIQPTFWRPVGGETEFFTFDVVGVYRGATPDVDETQFLFRHDYLMERVGDIGLVGWFVVEIADPERAAEVAESIDDRFANSEFETKTTTEKAFMKGFAEQIGNTGAILMAIVAVVFFVILLIAGNTMAQSVRERTSEALGVLKTLGFTDGAVLGLVLAEALLLVLVAAGLGLAGIVMLAPGLAPLVEVFLPVFYVPPGSLVLGAVLAVLLGLAAGGVPAWLASRLEIVDALRRR